MYVYIYIYIYIYNIYIYIYCINVILGLDFYKVPIVREIFKNREMKVQYIIGTPLVITEFIILHLPCMLCIFSLSRKKEQQKCTKYTISVHAIISF